MSYSPPPNLKYAPARPSSVFKFQLFRTNRTAQRHSQAACSCCPAPAWPKGAAGTAAGSRDAVFAEKLVGLGVFQDDSRTRAGAALQGAAQAVHDQAPCAARGIRRDGEPPESGRRGGADVGCPWQGGADEDDIVDSHLQVRHQEANGHGQVRVAGDCRPARRPRQNGEERLETRAWLCSAEAQRLGDAGGEGVRLLDDRGKHGREVHSAKELATMAHPDPQVLCADGRLQGAHNLPDEVGGQIEAVSDGAGEAQGGSVQGRRGLSDLRGLL
eukprot:CAMPEP_0183340750 /NCGR_PEP_ID=MMETSP0164_2-20130417/7192_1 /TAXON_ID=221442 /ORGANISM="Coccolithus pelagicus ssp braarudi, Strain PLY182g" /LENGTH=271 /DNA_ID=CAMNT_0025510931 /DNA_START=349 /DNA_END=1161 /DNA_ORIENTATION=+